MCYNKEQPIKKGAIMPFPNEFYYSETISAEQYSSNPQGVPNFIRMAQLKPDYWPKNFPTSVPKPKTLILADWTASCWSKVKQQAVVEKMAELMKSGFTIYFWDKDTLRKLIIPTALNSASVINGLTPAFPDEISHAMGEHKLTHDKTWVLDDYQIDLMLGQDPTHPRTIDAKALIDGPDERIAKKKALIKQANPRITAISLKELSSFTIVENDKAKASDLDIPVIREYQTINLKGRDRYDPLYGSFLVDEIKQVDPNKLTSITIDGYQFYSLLNAPTLNLKHLSLNYRIGDLNLNLSHFPNIKTLLLNEVALSANLSACSLAMLERLELRAVDAPEESFKKLFASVAHLKKLIVQSVDLPKGLLRDQISIEEIEYHSNNTDVLIDLLNNTPNISRLNATLSKPTHALTIEHDLLSLEDLTIGSYDDSAPSLFEADLINHARNLKTLSLCRSVLPSLRENGLPRLRRVKFSYQITNITLCELVKSAQHIEEINFFCSIFIEPLTIPKNSLNDLVAMDMSLFTGSSPENIINLLEAAPNLRSLTHNNMLGTITPELQTLLDRIPEIYIKEDKAPARHISNLNSIPSCPIPRTHRVDTNTTHNPNKTFNSKEIFYPTDGGAPPHVSKYRLQVFEEARFEQDACRIFSSTSQDFQAPQQAPTLHKKDVYTLHKPNCMYGKQTFRLTRDFQPIASLSPTEVMTDYHISPETASVEIAYCRQDNLYYIRSKSTQNQTVTLDFLMSYFLAPKLHASIETIAKEFRAFKSGTLVLKADSTEDDFVHAIRDQKVGACRHRAVAFKLYMSKAYPNTRVRIVENDCHMFVEVEQNSTWLNCDLGGYLAHVNIDHSNAPTASITTPTITQEPIHYSTSQQQGYQRYFETWKTSLSAPPLECLAYIERLLNGLDKKQLVQIHSSSLLSFALAIQKQGASSSRPTFYIHDADDLVCSAPFVKRDGDRGQLCQAPLGGGVLHDFLTKHNNPVLIVNYANFSAEDIVRLNGLLDDRPHADGTPLPPQAIVIGLIDPEKSTCYRGADFNSRFDKIIPAPQTIPPVLTPVLTEAPLDITLDENVSTINLCHAPSWRTQLMGGWVLKAGELYFEKGELVEKLGLNQPIVIQNPPNDEKFDVFWQQARLHGVIRHEGEEIALSPDEVLLYCEGYHWNHLLNQVTWSEAPATDACYLNPTRLNRIISDYRIEHHQFNKMPGILSQQPINSVFSIYVTRTLSEDEWGIFFKECQKYPSLHLSIFCAPDVVLPTSFNVTLPQAEFTKSREFSLPLTKDFSCIYSTDVDLTIALLTEGNEDWMVLDVSECTAQDLLIHLSGEMRGLTPWFNETPGALIAALNENKNVILTGDFSDELLDELTPFLIDYQHNSASSGHVVLVTKQPNTLLETHLHQVSVDEKKHQLSARGFTQEEMDSLEARAPQCMETQPFIWLLACLEHQRNHPEDSLQDAWYGLETLPSTLVLSAFNPDQSAQDAIDFLNHRRLSVERALAKKPYVFLAGLTGVGKSRFVEQHYKTTPTRQLYRGETTSIMKDWAEGVNDEGVLETRVEKVLFIDEANLSTRQWSEFEGLFNNPPGILIEGHYYPLTPQHKVIFAGNPLSYGDERTLANLFKRRPNTVVFEPLPMAVIYENIIKPVFENSTLSEEEVKVLAAVLLDVYHQLVTLSTHEVLISLREVQMMALLVHHYVKNHPDASRDERLLAANFYSRSMCAALVPINHKAQFDAAFPAVAPPRSQEPSNHSNTSFFYTESRQPIVQLLSDYLGIRKHRQSAFELNPAQKYGGLGGIILEGEPGIGKSDLVVHYLVSQGFSKGCLKMPNQGDVFYQIPVSMSLDNKKKCLLKAFDEGAVVILDEINSAPMMEQLLNALLMGQTPEGKFPSVAGFTVIGTQNPATMAGRRMASTALARRMQTCYMSPYPSNEMIAILQHKGLSPQQSHDLVDAFIMKCEQAKQEHRTPAPVFRNLMRAVDDVLRGELLSEVEVLSSDEDENTAQRIESNTINYGFMMKVFAHPATKVLSVVLFLAAALLLGVFTLGLGLVPLILGVAVSSAGLVAGVGLFSGSQVASKGLGDEGVASNVQDNNP
jgi:hypothetical protein